LRPDTRINTDAVSTGLCASGTSSPDAVFALTLAAPTRVRMSTSGSAFDTVLHVQESSCTSSGGFLCDDDGGPGSTSLIDMPLRADTYFIIVDGWGAANSGEYLLEVELSDP